METSSLLAICHSTRACQEEKYPKSILSFQPGIYVRFVMDPEAITGNRGRGRGKSQAFIISTSATGRDGSGLYWQLSCQELSLAAYVLRNRKQWRAAAASFWGL